MGKNYNDFCGISIYDTGLVRKSSYVAGVFKKNNIETLDELFRLDDDLSINYGANSVSSSYGDDYQHIKSQIRGIIRLIRYKYLNEELFVDTLYDNKYNLEQANFEQTYVPADSSTYRPRFNNFLNESADGKRINVDFKSLGFSDKEIEIICHYAYKLNGSDFEFGSMFLDISEDITKNLKEYNQRLFSNKSEQAIFLEKIRLISDFIKNNKKSREINESISMPNISIKELMEEEKRLILELNELSERSSKITNRISEIQKTLQGNKNIR